MFQTFLRFLSPIKYDKKGYFIYAGLVLFDTLQNVFAVQVTAFIITAITTKNIDHLWIGAEMMFALACVTLLVGNLEDDLYTKTRGKIGRILHQDYMGRFLRLDNNKTESLGTGKLNSIIITGADVWSSILMRDATMLAINFIGTFYILGVVGFSVGFVYFVALFCFSAVLLALTYYGNKQSVSFQKTRKKTSMEYSRSITRIIMSKFEILQCNKIEAEKTKLDDLQQVLIGAQLNENKTKALYHSLARICSGAMRAGIFLWLGSEVIAGKFEIAQCILITSLIGTVMMYNMSSMRMLRAIDMEWVHIEKLWDFFDTTPEIKALAIQTPFVFNSGAILLQNITFGYGEQKEIFNNFSLDIAAKKRTALVGQSGSGKSTLIKLIAGYLEPQEGQVLVDGQNISQVNLLSYYAHIGYLTQDPSIFDGTIRENLLYALSSVPTDEEIANILKLSHCDFVDNLTQGLDTEIGEKGVKLSGGQKQRLAIAKIMLKNPSIILLDEPTSALDSISEKAVNSAFDNLFKNRTVIVIAHRLQTVKESDEIIVFKDGKILERGTHEELSKKEGEYQTMIELQSSF